MHKFLRQLYKELSSFKDTGKFKNISVQLNNDTITGINCLYSTLYTSNRNMLGRFTDLNTIKKSNLNVTNHIESIDYIDYRINSNIYIHIDDLKRVMPGIPTEEYKDPKNLALIKKKLINVELSGLSSLNNDDTFIELNISNITYSKKDIIANEFIVSKSGQTQLLNFVEIPEIPLNNPEDILTSFYANMYINGICSTDLLKNLKLDEKILSISMRADENAVLMKESLKIKSTLKI